MITREADYAVRALLYLSKAGREKPLSSFELAKEMKIPYRFMRRIGLKLQKSGFIESRKGKGGGVKLLKNPSEIALLDVLKAFDEDGFKLNECLTGDSPCMRSSECPVHKEMLSLQEIIESRLKNVTFDKLLS